MIFKSVDLLSLIIVSSDGKNYFLENSMIQFAVRNDKELSKLLGDVTIANGRVMPNIHNLLLPNKTGSSKLVADED
ncbi:hypothetical protein Vadar_024789 [Vaccinium darrowii]|uniref:Uncharacterized protein n=1 Tax=Vaccinium darrowii TaxID=229202 RepID=A0ACB7XSX0_9ERIC|nr:hypothetical protein Vadar_024789 [Vaccinium darrowii]